MTELSEEYNYQHWRSDNENALILLSLKTNGDVQFSTTDDPLRIELGEKFLYLAHGEANDS